MSSHIPQVTDWLEVANAIQWAIYDLRAWADLASDLEETWDNPDELDGLCPSRAGVELTREETIPSLEKALDAAIRQLGASRG